MLKETAAKKPAVAPYLMGSLWYGWICFCPMTVALGDIQDGGSPSRIDPSASEKKDFFAADVFKKTGIHLEKITSKTYKYVPFVGRNSKRNHIFHRPADAVISSIVLHDTIGSLFSTLNKFSDAKEPLLNAHYVVTQRDKNISGGIAIEMVPPEYMAQHAWPSWFGGKDDCNQFSIGIELVGKGFVSRGGKRFFYPYDVDQIKTLGPLLQVLVQKYGIRPENIHSHGDVSPQRKYDVTIAFPWKTLYEKYGVGMGLSANENTEKAIVKKYQPSLPLPQKFDGLFFQKCLSQLGYDTRFAEDTSLSSADRGGKWTNVYQAFYAHFSRNGESRRWRGSPDYKDMFWAWALVAKYFQS